MSAVITVIVFGVLALVLTASVLWLAITIQRISRQRGGETLVRPGEKRAKNKS